MGIEVNRRAALGAAGWGALGLGVGGAAGFGLAPAAAASQIPAAAAVTVQSWTTQRGPRYFIAHRGSGDVYPEHSMEGYLAAVRAGARCLEISVGSTSDGRLVCMHDPTYDRSTTAKGTIAALPSTVLRGLRLSAPQLGPAWAQPPRPMVPLLEDVLSAFGGQVVMCIEAKNDAAYPAVMASVQAHGITDSVIVKASYDSKRIVEAKAAGYPVFAYFGTAGDVSPGRITTLARALDPGRDYLVLPVNGSDGGYLPADLVRRAVSTGIPVWAFPAHRRVDAEHFFQLGCTGIITSSFQYVSSNVPTAVSDTWAFGAVAPGEMTRDPSSSAYAPMWVGDELHLGVGGAQHFITLGQFGPSPDATGSYTIDFEACWLSLPANSSDNLTVAFGRPDDSYYEHRLGSGNGYHAILRVDGGLELYRHQQGRSDGTPLGESVATSAARAGEWMAFQVRVTPGTINWSRVDTSGATVPAVDNTIRGGYLHIGRSSTDGLVAFRRFIVR